MASAFSAIMAWILIANGWRPQMRLNLADIRPYLRFGWAVVGGNIVNYSNMSFDLLLGGRLLGVESLGLFSIPRNLILQIQFTVNPIITRVGFPLIAQIQHDIPRVRAVYLKTMKMTVSCNAPIYIGLAFYAPEIVYVLLGKNWISSIDLLRILAIWGLFRSMGNPVGILLLGMGRAGLALKWNLALLVITPPVLWFGSLYGAKGMAIAMAIFTGIMFVPGWYILVRPLCYLKLGDYIGAVFKPTLIALLAISVSFIIAGCCVHPMTRLLVGVVLSVCFYAAVSYVFNRELLDSVSQLILGRDFGLRVLS